ncbi:AEC family transporter [Amphritea sp.]|uniref:AEC family transporter n=1 Tax=Amphritea sp. TaxID=1872502 RepID=UPI0025C718AE|nr:AEC family transporter [Amphritea sp.]
MIAIINITAPIFLIILFGFIAVRSTLIPKSALSGMSKFVLFMALPALIFSKISEMPISELVDMQYILSYSAGCLGVLVLGILANRFVLQSTSIFAGIKGLGSALPNSAFIGLPVMLQFFQSPPAQAFAMVILVENIILFPVALAFIEFASAKEGEHKKISLGMVSSIGKKVMLNPIIQSVICGVVFSLSGLALPEFAEQGLVLLGAGSAPVALIIIGGSLVGVSIRSSLADIAIVSGFKLLLHPLIVGLMVVFVFPGMATEMKQAAVLFAASPMLSIYPIIGGQYGYQTFCSGALLVATILSFFSVSVVLSLLHMI